VSKPALGIPLPENEDNEIEQALYVLKVLDTGGWELKRCVWHEDRTDEFNLQGRWLVTRTCAPFSDDEGVSQWNAPTAYAAIRQAVETIADKWDAS